MWSIPELAESPFVREGTTLELVAGEGLPGQAWVLGRAMLAEDLARVPRLARVHAARAAGLVAGLGIPVAFGGVVIGVMTFFRRREERPDDAALKTLDAIGRQIGQFLVRTHGEQALALSERKARALLEQAAEGIIVVDRVGRIEMVNAKAETMLGYTRSELIGQTLEILLPERFRGPHREHRASYFAAPRTRPMGLGLELAARRKDGSEFPVEISLSHAETETGMVAMAFVTDVTERRALERASRHAERLTALGTLAAGIAHELNNPLGILSSRIELMLLESDALPAPVREDLGVLHRNAVRATQITQRLLSFARQPGGEHRVLDVNAVVQEALALVRPQIDKDGVHVHTALEAGLPAIHADPTALHQVLVNLLINAREAMTGGEVVVRTRRAVEPGWIQLVVTDTGPGMPPEVLARIFDPFYTTKPTGTGLGLAITYGIVREHHGRIDVESAPGKGTSFVLTLPAVAGEVPPGGPT
jgi:PAS domain S-box-containing protein